MHCRQRQAAVDADPINDDRTGPALSVVASHFGAVEAQIVSQEIEQGNPGVIGDGMLAPVDGQCLGHARLLFWSTRSSGKVSENSGAMRHRSGRR